MSTSKLLQNVLVASNGTPFNTNGPSALLNALFPSSEGNFDERTSLIIKQWMRMLDALSPLEKPVDIRLATQTRLMVESSSAEIPSEIVDEVPYTCFVKIHTIRESVLGSVQVYQVGKLDRSCYNVVLAEPPQYVVIKAFEMQKTAYAQDNPLNEVTINCKLMREAKENNGILPYLGCLATPDTLYALFPYAQDGDMFRFLSEAPQKLSEPQIRVILREMLQGIGFCHNNLICHRDISLENFMRLGDSLALIDFGLSIEMNQSDFSVINRGPVGKTKYMAPELALGKPGMVDGRKLDIWSLGVTLFMLITQTEPFLVALNVDERYRALVTRKQMRPVFGSWGISISNSLMNLLESMLNPDPTQRPTVDEILSDSWMLEC